VYARDHLQLSGLLCHRYRHGPHPVGVASGSLGNCCKTCLCACPEAPRLAATPFVWSNHQRVVLNSGAVRNSSLVTLIMRTA